MAVPKYRANSRLKIANNKTVAEQRREVGPGLWIVVCDLRLREGDLITGQTLRLCWSKAFLTVCREMCTHLPALVVEKDEAATGGACVGGSRRQQCPGEGGMLEDRKRGIRREEKTSNEGEEEERREGDRLMFVCV
jgi:hypothetical protein